MKSLLVSIAAVLSICISAFGQQWVEVTYPNGGETWQIGSNPAITWTHSPGFISFDIQLSRNNAGNWETLVTGLPGLAVNWNWNAGVTPPPSNNCRIKIVGHTAAGTIIFDNSNANFAIVDGGGGGQFQPDEYTEALWHFNEAPGTFIAHDISGNNYDINLQDGAVFTPAGMFQGAVDLIDPDAKINSNYLIGNGWNELTIDAYIKPAFLSPDESPIVERYQFYASDPAYYLTILPDGSLYGGVYQSGGGYSQLTTPSVITAMNQWYYIQMTWTAGEQLKIFVNGQLAGASPSTAGAIRQSTHPLTIGWFHDTGYGDFFFNGIIDEVRISDIDRSEGTPPPPQSINVAMLPYGAPIVIQPGGGAFAYNVEVSNNGYTPVDFDGWTNITVPGGAQFTILGPLSLTLGAGTSVDRDRTVFVPPNAPPGEYLCTAFAGEYPWNVISSSAFPFIKEGTDGEWDGPSGWYCKGEMFSGEIPLSSSIPDEFELKSPCPNPFNNSTTITFTLPAAGEISLKVYDISGREVQDLGFGIWDLGAHSVVWDAGNQATGVYFVRLTVDGEQAAVKKIVLMK